MPFLADLAVVVLVTVVLAGWIAAWRASRRPGALAMVLSLVFLDLALAIGPFETATGLLSRPATLWGAFGVHALTMIAGYWLVVFCHDGAAGSSRRPLGLVLVALVVLFGLFLAGPVREHLETVSSAHGDQPFVLAYLVVFTVYLAAVEVEFAVTSARQRHTGWGAWLRTVGAAVGAVFCLHRVLYTLLVMNGVRPPWPDYGASGVGTLLLVVAVVVQLAGIMSARRAFAS